MQPNESLVDTNRRKEPRFRVALPATIDSAVGHTKDISVSDIYATLPNSAHLDLGASVRFEMLFYHADPNGPLKVLARVKSFASSAASARRRWRAHHVLPIRDSEPLQLNR